MPKDLLGIKGVFRAPHSGHHVILNAKREESPWIVINPFTGY